MKDDAFVLQNVHTGSTVMVIRLIVDNVKICEIGTYGVNCNETCGHCRDLNQCSYTNGTCFTGCNAGYHGAQCKTGEYID